ncbi:MAG: hypothetical protein Pg6C_14680 [Treponemataceae bacterium]|nr:MAG: hypothetical protein Pg6C_14680 [Treponemataceae bacterium]
MSENLILRLFENILPLLLSIIILLAIVYFLIQKITSPFSRFGNFLYARYNYMSDAIARSRKDKLKKQIELQNIRLSDLENKYNRSAKSLIEIKGKLNDLSKYFTEMDQCGLQNDISRETVKNNGIEISASVTDSKNIFKKLAQKAKIMTLTRANKKIELYIQKNEQAIAEHKILIKKTIGELLESIGQLSG